MLEEFAVRALLGGGALALMAGPVGAVMLWRKMAFFGATVAEGAVLGVVLALLTGISPLIGATAACLAMALTIEFLRMQGRFADDTIVGVIGHSALAFALVLTVYLVRSRFDLLAYLFGDVLSLSWSDVEVSWIATAIVLLFLVPIWRPLILATAEPDIAAAEGSNVKLLSLVFAFLLAGVVAIGLRTVGALLIVSLLIMPAAAARPFTRTPLQMALLATLFAVISIGAGIVISFQANTTPGPTVAGVAAIIYAISWLKPRS